MSAKPMDAKEIKQRFAKKATRFYIVNFIMALVIGVGLYQAKVLGIYKEAFVPIIVLFLLWIFNIDKLYRCPACGQVPRGKEGLIYLPKNCTACDVELR
tara:strand:+ start:966 stop:1262 length:297 start_codon:yes stop_codon:yes gene_type:complete